MTRGKKWRATDYLPAGVGQAPGLQWSPDARLFCTMPERGVS